MLLSKFIRIFCAGGILAICWASLAAPLQRADVAAQPTWVLHIDCDGLRPTQVGKYLLAELDKPDAQSQFATFQTLFSFDPRKQLHGLTLYSTSHAPDDGVMLIYADFNPERLVTLAKAANDSLTTNYGPHTIYSWIDDGRTIRNGFKTRMYAAIQGSRVILAQRKSRLISTLDVLDQTQADLASTKVFPELGAERDRSFIEAAARNLDLPGSTPTAALFRLAKMLRLQVSETNATVTATLKFEANNEDVARQTVIGVQGAAAWARLQKGKPGLSKFFELLSLKQDGATVVATIGVPAADFVEILKAETEKKPETKAR